MSREAIIKYGTAVVVLIVGILLSRWTGAIVRKRTRKFAKSKHLRNILSILAQISVVILIFVFILDWLDLGTTAASLAAGAGVIGIVIGYGAKRLLEEATAATIIFFNHHFEVGDWVKIGKHIGKVTTIGFSGVAMVTRLKESLFLPATFVISKPLVNYTRKTLSRETKELWRTIKCSISPKQLDALRKFVKTSLAKETGVTAVDVTATNVSIRKSYKILTVIVSYKARFDEPLHYRLTDKLISFCATNEK